MGSRPYLYHVLDDTSFDGKGDFASIEISVPKNKDPADPTDREMKKFYSLKRDLAALRKEGKTKGIVDDSVVSLSPQTGKGNDILAIKVGTGKHKALICGAHHSREWISVECAYYAAEYLIRNFKTSPTTEEEKRIKHLLANREIWFVPMVNPDGHAVCLSDNRFWRPNQTEIVVPADTKMKRKGKDILIKKGTYKGVDINRNYATSDWGTETFMPAPFQDQAATSTNPMDMGEDSTFCGQSAGSELETQAMMSLVKAQKFRACMSFHSFGADYIFADASDTDPFLKELRDGVAKLVSTYKMKTSSSYTYRTSGDMIAFMDEVAPGRPNCTPEVRPPDPPRPPTAKKFSGLPEAEIEPCVKENLPAVLAFINAAGFDGASTTVSMKADAKAALVQVVRASWRPFENWNPTMP